MRRPLFIAVSILVSVVFLWLALRNVKLEEVLRSLQQAEFGWVLISFLSMSLGMWTRGRRWQGLLDFRLPYLQTSHILNIGFMLNNLPLRAGELARTLLATRSGVPVVTAATSVVLERMVDTLLVVILLVIAIPRLPNVPAEIARSTTIFGVAVMAAFVVMIIFARFPDMGHRFLVYVERLFPFVKRLGLDRLFDQLLDGLKPLTHLRSGIDAIVWTLISWSISLFTIYALVRALNIQGVDQLLLAVMGLSLASFSIAIPVSVASLGPFQAAVLLAGQAVGAPDAQAISLGFLFHGVNVLGYCLWGVVGLVALGVSLGDVLGRRSTEAETEQP